MSGFENPFKNNSFSNQWKFIYHSNREMIWVSLGAFLTMLALKTPFISAFIFSYFLFFSSVLFRTYLAFQKMVYTLVFGMISGLLLYLIVFSSQMIPAEAMMAGIGAAAFSLLTATATYAPNGQIQLAFFGRIKLKWIVLMIIGLDLLSINPSALSPRIAHVGGIIYGFLSIYLNSRSIFKNGLNFRNLFKRPGPYYKKPKNSNSNASQASRETDEQYNARKNKEQKEIDKILEKIKMNGYDSLSSDEKKRLFDQSKK